MDFTTVKELYRNSDAYIGKEIKVGGWVRSIRDSKTVGFIVLHDGSFFETLQIVYSDSLANFAEISKLNVGAAVIIEGTLVATPNAKQPFEIQATSVAVEGTSSVKVSFRSEVIGGLGREVLLNQQGHISWMEQTKAWKLYQRLKGTRKR